MIRSPVKRYTQVKGAVHIHPRRTRVLQHAELIPRIVCGQSRGGPHGLNLCPLINKGGSDANAGGAAFSELLESGMDMCSASECRLELCYPSVRSVKWTRRIVPSRTGVSKPPEGTPLREPMGPNRFSSHPQTKDRRGQSARACIAGMSSSTPPAAVLLPLNRFVLA